MRLLASVRADVYRQGTALNEALAAPWCLAGVRSLIGVYAVMSLQVRLAVEALSSYLVSGLVFASRYHHCDMLISGMAHTLLQDCQSH